MATDETPDRCPHGSTLDVVCPYCDPEGFLFAYAKTRAVIERMPFTDDELRAMVQQVRAGGSHD